MKSSDERRRLWEEASRKRVENHKRECEAVYGARRVVLAEMGFDTYVKYLDSELWSLIREIVLLSSPMCRLCYRPAIQVHHISYDRETMLGDKLENLIALCGGCHRKLEFNHDNKRSPLKVFALTRRLLKKKRRKPEPLVSKRPRSKPWIGYYFRDRYFARKRAQK